MSSKIVSITGAPLESVLPITPDVMFHHLRALWVSRVISQDALAIGNMACGVMQRAKSRIVSFSMYEAAHAYVATATGQVLSGPATTDRLELIKALQDLHFKVGILNHKHPEELEDEDAALRHFTRSPETSRSSFNQETPLVFQLPRLSAEAYAEQVAVKFREAMEPCTIAITMTL